MGSFYSSCNLSRLQILDNDRIVALLLYKEDNRYSHGPCQHYEISSLPLTGTYADYGQIELDDTKANRKSVDLLSRVICQKIGQNIDFPKDFESFKELQELIQQADSDSKLSQFSFTFFHEKLFNDLIQSDLVNNNYDIENSWNNWETIFEQIWHHYEKTKNQSRFIHLIQKPYIFLRVEHDIHFSEEEKKLLQLNTREVEYFVDTSLNRVLAMDLTTFAMLDFIDQAEKENKGNLHSFEGYTEYRNLAINIHQFYKGLELLNVSLIPQITSGQELNIMQENKWQMKILAFTHDKMVELKEEGRLEEENIDNIKDNQLATLENNYLDKTVNNFSKNSKKGIKI